MNTHKITKDKETMKCIHIYNYKVQETCPLPFKISTQKPMPCPTPTKSRNIKGKIITLITLMFPCSEMKRGFTHLTDGLHSCLSCLKVCLGFELHSINEISLVNK